MKHFTHCLWDGTAVWITWHDVCHVLPLFLADLNSSDGIPACLVFDFNITNQLIVLSVKKDAIVVSAMRFECGFQFWPNWAVTFLRWWRL
jgi:hypothetical protein